MEKRIDDIWDRAATAQVVDRSTKTLRSRANGAGLSRPSNCLISVVDRVQVWEEKTEAAPGLRFVHPNRRSVGPLLDLENRHLYAACHRGMDNNSKRLMRD